MKRLLSILYTISLFSVNPSWAQDSRKYDSFELNTVVYDFAYFLPTNFDSANVYPVLIGPGDGVRGSDKSFFWNVDDPTEFGWILIEFSIWKQNSNVVEALMKKLKEDYNVEGDKFHIVGFSANSASSFGHAIANPEYFHSVTGIPGHPSSRNESQIKSLANVKVQNIVGEKDTYWLKSAQDLEELYTELGVSSTLEVIPNGEHVLRIMVGAGFMEKMERMRK